MSGRADFASAAKPAANGAGWLEPPKRPSPKAADMASVTPTTSGLVLPSALGPLPLYAATSSGSEKGEAPTATRAGLGLSAGLPMEYSPSASCSSAAAPPPSLRS